ncbi:transcription antitermination factor NusB [Endozoicomonas sp. SCSIO W0465]|uniref:transcription antitermination factor NusB n=1 Tax=Endozoicomonas sp. SCSIO W0465 TaxID=2918516 RepID=UPI0020751E00|nr:transcription antitermination factor NusB [Endozoicomonas sp. SCSIO W0465]USE37579.1 transcription antitermination factor NusB [Endozoicomonas sp. SCSIO W0465]
MNNPQGAPFQKKSPDRLNPSARRRARQLALQALYQWQIAKSPLNQIEAQFRTDNDFSKVDDGYFSAIIHGVPSQANQLDEAMTAVLDRSLNQLDPVELSALRIGCFELMNRKDVPYRVVINEAIELVKRFGAQDSHRYINGILDKLAPRLRSEEVKAYRKK